MILNRFPDKSQYLRLAERYRVVPVCTQVLAATGDPRAGEILARAHSELQEWATRCPDEKTRRSFLENVPWNREIVRLWQLAHPAVAVEGEG